MDLSNHCLLPLHLKRTLRVGGFHTRAKDDLNIKIFHAPPSSPDFNAIENVWRIIKSRLKRRLFTKKEDLKRAVLEEWNALQPHEWMKYIQQMPQRLAQCISRHGFATEYQAFYYYLSHLYSFNATSMSTR